MNRAWGLLLALTLPLISCQSTPVNSEENSITADSQTVEAGDHSSVSYTILRLHFDRPSLVRSWLVQWISQDGTVVYSASGCPPTLPRILVWDGRNESALSAPGKYKARLTVDYGNRGGVTSTTSDPFEIAAVPENVGVLRPERRPDGGSVAGGPDFSSAVLFDPLE
jgi:hypothetical protein